MRPSALHHLAIVVADLRRSEHFWIDVLGLPVLRRHHTAEGAHRATWIELGAGAFLALERAGAAGPRRADEAPGAHCVALAIEPSTRDAWRWHLASAGLPVERESAFTLYVRDPDGVLVGLSHHPEPALVGS
jgi:catechol 2,3-dioxygenase-like lactoylglutathione lyase family enzyme